MKKFIISPPFGQFITHHQCTRVLGTYTLHRRGGWLNKFFRILLTLRPTPGGWINNVGLQNPGIKDIQVFQPEHIYSITAINHSDWDEMLKLIPEKTTIEINLGCPNTHTKTTISHNQVTKLIAKFPTAIFKLAATEDIYNEANQLINLGAKYLHIANTMPTPRGGESGKRLKEFSLNAIKKIKSSHPNVTIIGGGGIYSNTDIDTYTAAGAEHLSLATIWLKPWQAIKLLKNNQL